jgi:hypothetical protein
VPVIGRASILPNTPGERATILTQQPVREPELREGGQPGAPPLAPARAGAARRFGAAGLSVAALVLVVCLSGADGLVAGVVPFERDTSAFYYPLMRWAADQLRHGTFPLWIPSIFSGYPIFADGEIGLAYPPALLALLALPTDRALVLLRLLHLALAAVGTYLLARAWRLPHPAATLAGVTFALGSFFQTQIHHENIVRTAAWLPWMLLGAEHALRARGRGRLAWTGATAAAIGLAGLSLHTQLLVEDLLVLAGYGLLRWGIGPIATAPRTGDRLRALLAVFPLAAGLGVALAAVQLIPLGELARFSPRGSGIPYSAAAAYSLTPVGLVQLVFPFFFRTPADQQWGLWTHWESYLYVGLVPLLLTVVALVCVRRAEVTLWSIMGALGVLLSLGQYSPVNLHMLLWLLPGLAGLRAPGRFSLIVVLAAAMLSAYGLAWLAARRAGPTPGADGPERGRRRLLGGFVALPILLAVVMAAAHALLLAEPAAARDAIERWYLALPHDTYPLTPSDVYLGLLAATDLRGNARTTAALVALALVAGLLWAWQAGRWPRVRRWPLWPAVLVGVTAADLLVFGWSVHPRDSLARLSRSDATAAAVAARSTTPEPTRVLASPVLNQVAPNRLVPLGLGEVNGYSSLESGWHQTYVDRVVRADDALLDLAGVRYVLDPTRYGSLPSYRGVSFQPGQALLHAVGGSALGVETFALDEPATIGRLGLVTALVDAVELPQGTPVAELDLLGPDGGEVAHYELQAGRDTMEWAWDNPVVRAAVRHQRVEVAGVTFEGGPDGTRLLSYAGIALDPPSRVAGLSVRTVLPRGELYLYGGALTDTDGHSQQLLGRHQTKYHEVARDPLVTAYANDAAFPRAFFVPTARVADSLDQTFDQMTRQPFDPAHEVVLTNPGGEVAGATGGASAPAAGGPPAATIDEYAPGYARLRVQAPAAGYLVLTDSFYPGWRASVDDRPAPILRADLLFRAVAVPAGEHTVRFWFDPDSLKLGLALSLAALVVVLGLLLAPLLGRLGLE